MCEYYKIIPTAKYGSYRICKFSKFITPGNKPLEFLFNVLELIYYDIDRETGIPIHMCSRHNYENPYNYIIETRQIKDYVKITKEEFNKICNILKEEKRIIPIEQPKEPYILKEGSTNTHITYIPRKGFEFGKRHIFDELVYFDSLGAAYPMPVWTWFENKPIEIIINKSKFKGDWKFIEEESDLTKSVYKRVWSRKKIKNERPF